MDKKGEVIWHKSFPFSNGGEPKDKFLILLNTPDKEEPFLFALTTSKPKTQTLGCHSDKGYFVIEGGKEKVFQNVFGLNSLTFKNLMVWNC